MGIYNFVPCSKELMKEITDRLTYSVFVDLIENTEQYHTESTFRDLATFTKCLLISAPLSMSAPRARKLILQVSKHSIITPAVMPELGGPGGATGNIQQISSPYSNRRGQIIPNYHYWHPQCFSPSGITAASPYYSTRYVFKIFSPIQKENHS